MTVDPNKQPEQRARANIDAALTEAGWLVQSRKDMNVAAGLGVAIREFKTDAGFADYLLYVDKKPAGVIEAKREGVVLTGIEAQTKDYAAKVPKEIPVPIRPLPFLYESTGVETRFTNVLDPTPRSRKVFSFHQPKTLKGWLDDAIAIAKGRPGAPVAATFLGRMKQAPPLNAAGMWPAQIGAVEKLEQSIKGMRPRALIQMATGSGKTYTAIAAIYRLIKFGGARRVLFLVDRGNLGRQAYKEFQAYTTPDDGRKFTELYNVSWLSSNKIDPVNRVVITTIQRLYSILKGDVELDPALEEGSAFLGSGAALVREPPPVVYSQVIPPEHFDVVVIDECHRSIYSLWRQVLEYFDASLVGLTATPAKNTFAFFDKNVVSKYRHEHAVRDKVNVPFEVYEIRTRITEGGAALIVDPADPVVVGKRDRRSRAVRWEALDEDLSYVGTALDRSVVSKDQIRTVIREFKDKLFTGIFPGRSEIPKTLFFAKNDNHAEDILDVIREEFGIGNEEAVKVTYKPERAAEDDKRVSASARPEAVIQRFRNSYQPRIAVTVDMIATGTDIKPLECVVFMRSVKSRGLFEQMKGRGVRVIPDADFQAVTPDAKVKTHFVVVDAVGVMDDPKSDPPILRERSLSFDRVLELVRAGNRDEDVLATLAARLDRVERKLDHEQQQAIEQASGGISLHAIVAGLLDGLDPDREDARAREVYGLGAETEPSEAQVTAVQEELRERAAEALAYNEKLCQVILDVRRQQDQLVDATSIDEVTRSGPAAHHAVDYDRELVVSFESFIEEHRNEIDALQILYSRPYGERLTREKIKALADAIKQPPRQWTTEGLWAAYEKVGTGRVKGASGGRLWTDIVALARYALHPEDELVPFADQVHRAFEGWLAQQENKGKTFTGEQLRWLEMIRDRIAGDAEVRMEDFDDVPFLDAGGLGRFYAVFGEEYEAVVAELNAELVA
jgi:type I restriction enzyme, R subunit